MGPPTHYRFPPKWNPRSPAPPVRGFFIFAPKTCSFYARENAKIAKLSC